MHLHMCVVALAFSILFHLEPWQINANHASGWHNHSLPIFKRNFSTWDQGVVIYLINVLIVMKTICKHSQLVMNERI